MKRRTQILIIILIATTVIYSLSVGYLGFFIKNQAIRDAKQIARNTATEYANRIRADLERDIGVCRATASAMKSKLDLPLEEQVKIYNNTLRDIFIKNDYLTVWNSWELNAFNPNYTKTHGRLRSEYYEFNGNVILEVDSADMEQDNVNSLYYQIKLQNQENITRPYWYSTDERVDEILVTSIAVPVQLEGEFAGLAGIDRSLKSFQDTLKQIRPFGKGYIYMLAHEGSFIAHPDDESLGKKFSQVYPEVNSQFGVEQKVREGRSFSFMVPETDNQSARYFTFAPFTIGNTDKTWSVAIAVPYDVIVEDANENLFTAIAIGVIGLLLLTLLFLFVSRRVAHVLVDISDRLGSLARGNIEETNKMRVMKETDELGRIKLSVNQLIDGLNKTVSFAVNIGKGNLEASYEKLSDEDAFGEALLNMRDNLRKVRQEEQNREEENRKRNWVNDGIARINDILRIYRNRETEEFAYQIVSSVVDYLEANQAGLFFVEESDNEEGTIIDLKAAYAYNRRKLYDKQIKPGVGLIGRAVKEQRPIFMTDVPDHYLKITSGIGNSTPSNVLIVPLISEEYVYGVIELASFRIFKEHERQFISRTSEIIASAIATQRYSVRTSELLRESNKKSEELANQEEEMRKNLAELRAAQEESQRAEREMSSILEAVTSTSSVIHLDSTGKIEKVVPSKNEDSRVYGTKATGNYISELDLSAIETPELYQRMWDNLRNGKEQDKILHVDIHEDNRWISEVYTPVFGAKGRIERVVLIQTDITQRKLNEDKLKKNNEELKHQEQKLRKSIDSFAKSQRELLDKNRYLEKINALQDKAFMRAEMNIEGALQFVNENFAIAFGLNRQEMEGQNLFEYVKIEGEKDVADIQEELKNGVIYNGELKFVFPTGEERWFMSNFSPDFDNQNNLQRIFYLGTDITSTKKMEIRLKQQAARQKQQEQKIQQQMTEMKKSQQLILQKNTKISSMTKALDKSFLRAELNENGQIADANSNMLNLLGYNPSEIKDKPLSDLMPVSSREKHTQLLKELYEGEVVEETIELTAKNDYKFAVLYTLAPLEGEKGQLQGIIFIGYDITDFIGVE